MVDLYTLAVGPMLWPGGTRNSDGSIIGGAGIIDLPKCAATYQAMGRMIIVSAHPTVCRPAGYVICFVCRSILFCAIDLFICAIDLFMCAIDLFMCAIDLFMCAQAAGAAGTSGDITHS